MFLHRYLLTSLMLMCRLSYVQARQYRDLQGPWRQQHSPEQCCWLGEIPPVEGCHDVALIALLVALASVIEILAHCGYHGPLGLTLRLLQILLVVFLLLKLLLLILGLFLLILLEELMGSLLVVQLLSHTTVVRRCPNSCSGPRC